MGGFGSGGQRVGAGRKSKGARVLALHGGRDRSKGAKKAEGAASAPEKPVNPPEGMPEAQKAVWCELAPHALAARTLTPGTAAAFGLLCKQIVLEGLMFAQIMKDGLTGDKVTLQMEENGAGLQSVEKKAHTLLAQHRGMMQRVEAGYAKFKLAPIGKEIVQPAKAEDPFEEFMGAESK